MSGTPKSLDEMLQEANPRMTEAQVAARIVLVRQKLEEYPDLDPFIINNCISMCEDLEKEHGPGYDPEDILKDYPDAGTEYELTFSDKPMPPLEEQKVAWDRTEPVTCTIEEEEEEDDPTVIANPLYDEQQGQAMADLMATLQEKFNPIDGVHFSCS